MPTESSLKRLITGIENQDSQAVTNLFRNYFPKLERISDQLLASYPGAAIGAEDIAQSTLKSFVHKLSDGHSLAFPSHDKLLSYLALCAKRKAQNANRDERTLKRGGGKTRLECDSQPDELGFSPVETAEGTLYAKDLDDAGIALLEVLTDDELRRIVLLKLSGYSIDEIAGILSRQPSAIRRKLELIRKLWREFLENSE